MKSKQLSTAATSPSTGTTNQSPPTSQEAHDNPLLMTSRTQSLCNPGYVSAKIFRLLSSLAGESCCSSIHRSIEAGSTALKLWDRSLPRKQNRAFQTCIRSLVEEEKTLIIIAATEMEHIYTYPSCTVRPIYVRRIEKDPGSEKEEEAGVRSTSVRLGKLAHLCAFFSLVCVSLLHNFRN